MASTPTKLFYFNGRGRAEQARLALSEAGIEFEDVSLTRETFVGGKADGTLKLQWGSVPYLQIDGLDLVQSPAILLYIARKAGWEPATPAGKYAVETVLFAADDARSAASKTLPNFGGKRADTEYLKSTVLPRKLGEFSASLSENDFFANNTFSVADVSMFDVLTAVTDLVPGALDSYDNLRKFVERIAARPNIAAYLSSDRRRPALPPLDKQLEAAEAAAETK